MGIYIYIYLYIYWGIIGIFRRCLGGPCRVGFTLYIGIARVRIYIYIVIHGIFQGCMIKIISRQLHCT